jgi:hypothetical protein
MKLIITLLALSVMYAAEGTPPPNKPELPADVKAKVEEIRQLRQQTEVKVEELKVILKNYPELEKRFNHRMEFIDKAKEHIRDRVQDRKQNREHGDK